MVSNGSLSLEASLPISAGDTIDATGVGGNPVGSNSEVRIVWTSPNGDNSATLSRQDAPSG
jgi:hypothetical protein